MVILCDCLHEAEARNKEAREGGRLQGSAILDENSIEFMIHKGYVVNRTHLAVNFFRSKLSNTAPFCQQRATN